MGSEHNWVATGGANTGYHLLGSARPFYDVQSNVSSSGTDGRILVTSDSSRLFHVGSAGTMFLGGSRAVSAGSVPVGGQQFYWAMEFGEGVTASGITTITFPNSGFSGIPWVFVERTNDVRVDVISDRASRTKTTFQALGRNIDTSALADCNFDWFSIGTRTF